MNKVKQALFYCYAVYEARFPIAFGKYRLAQLLYKVFGLVAFDLEGFTIELNPVAAIDRALILGLAHDEVVSEQIRRISPGKTFIDIGANIGYFSLYAASRSIGVYAFEPSPREAERLRRNVALNRFTSVTVFEQGISRTKEVLPLHLGMDYNPGQNSVLEVSASSESVACSFAPLHTFLSPEQLKDVGLVKIDVEGFELSVLQGMEEVIPHLTCPVVVEITPAFFAKAGHTAQDVYDFMQSHGYRSLVGLNERARRYDEVFVKDLSQA